MVQIGNLGIVTSDIDPKALKYAVEKPTRMVSESWRFSSKIWHNAEICGTPEAGAPVPPLGRPGHIQMMT